MLGPFLQRALRRRRVAKGIVVALGALAGACGAFSLNDVTPEVDGGGPDSHRPDASSSNDADADAARADVDADGGPDVSLFDSACDASGDPCNCLPAPTTLAKGIDGVLALAIDGNDLYWVARASTYALFRLPVTATDASNPGPFSDTFSLAAGKIDGLPFDSKKFYLALQGTRYYIATVVIDSDGGAKAQDLTPHVPAIPTEVLVGPKGVYWSDTETEICFAYLDGGLPAKADSGCGAKPLAPAADGGGTSNNALALSTTSVFQSIYKTGAIRSVQDTPLTVGPPKTILQRDPDETRELYATTTDLFFSESSSDSGTIFRVAPSGVGVVSPLIEPTGPIGSFVVEATQIYFAVDYLSESPTTTIFVVPRGGGVPTLVACDPQPEYLLTDSEYLYWWSAFDNTLHRVKKP
jgi:hypothetical protein